MDSHRCYRVLLTLVLAISPALLADTIPGRVEYRVGCGARSRAELAHAATEQPGCGAAQSVRRASRILDSVDTVLTRYLWNIGSPWRNGDLRESDPLWEDEL